MKQFTELLDTILKNGRYKENRTGTDTFGIHGYQMRFNLDDGFPIITTKKIHMKSVIHELLWMLSGDTNIKYLKENNVTIWNEWADADGELGPVYGYQWRNWETFSLKQDQNNEKMQLYEKKHFDQISNVVNTLKTNPGNRRIIVSAWNIADIDKMNLPPCHLLFQFLTFKATTLERQKFWAKKHGKSFSYVQDMDDENLDKQGAPKYILDCILYQRSCDTFLGVPFNISFYSLLTMMMAQVCNMIPHEFIWTGGDVHIYQNHIDQVKLQRSRKPFPLPMMKINPEIKDIFSFKFKDFELVGYQSHPAIKGEVAV
ncbi:thymidylate synthase [Candidatus Nomurabacteria bacterium]|nr:thymidylate synthase [Candidatus Nomurabacteria bacterium]